MGQRGNVIDKANEEEEEQNSIKIKFEPFKIIKKVSNILGWRHSQIIKSFLPQ